MTVELLDLKNDFVFKQVFGTEENKDVLISFINAVIKEPVIKDVTLTNTEIQRYTSDNKSVRLDIKAETTEGILIDVEIQCRNTGELVDRALYYAMAMIVENSKTSFDKQFKNIPEEIKEDLMDREMAKYQYKYPKAICIWILNTDIFPNRKDYREVISFHLEDTRYDGKEMATDKVKIYMLSLPKFNPQTEMEKEQKDLLTKWMTFLKRPENGEILEDKAIKKSYKALEVLSRTPETKNYYEAIEKGQSIRMAEISFALREELKKELQKELQKGKKEGIKEGKKEGIKEGEKRGLEKGKKEGIKEGIEKGKAEGEHKKAIETARNFLKMGLSIEQVAQGTGLSIEEITKL